MHTGQVPPKAPPAPIKAVAIHNSDIMATVEPSDATSAAIEKPVSMTLVGRIQSLDQGECCSESRYIDFNTTDRETFDQVIKALRSTVNKAVSRAAARTGGQYSTVTGHYMTRDNNIVVVATALRTG